MPFALTMIETTLFGAIVGYTVGRSRHEDLLFRWHRHRARSHARRHRVDQALQCYALALKRAEELEPRRHLLGLLAPLGEYMERVGMGAASEAMMLRSSQYHREFLKPGHRARVQALKAHGEFLGRRGRGNEALGILALAQAECSDFRTRSELQVLRAREELRSRLDTENAQYLLLEVLEGTEEVGLEDENPSHALARLVLSALTARNGNLERAKDLADSVFAPKVLDWSWPRVERWMTLAQFHQEGQNLEASLACLDQALKEQEERRGEKYFGHTKILEVRAATLGALGRYAEMQRDSERSLALAQYGLHRGSWRYALFQLAGGYRQWMAWDPGSALERFLEARGWIEGDTPPDPFEAVAVYQALAHWYLVHRQDIEAVEALEAAREILAERNPFRKGPRAAWVHLVQRHFFSSEAEARLNPEDPFDEDQPWIEEHLGRGTLLEAQLAQGLAHLYLCRDRPLAAKTLFTHAAKIRQELQDPLHFDRIQNELDRVQSKIPLEPLGGERAFLDQLSEDLGRCLGEGHPQSLRVQEVRASVASARDQDRRARRIRRTILELAPEPSFQSPLARIRLARSELALGRLPEAKAGIDATWEALSKIPEVPGYFYLEPLLLEARWGLAAELSPKIRKNLERALEILDQSATRLRAFEPRIFSLLAQEALDHGQIPQAELWIQRLEADLDSPSTPSSRGARALLLRARLEFEAGHFEGLDELYRKVEALEVPRVGKNSSQLAEWRLGRIRLALARGDRRGAKLDLEAARNAWEGRLPRTHLARLALDLEALALAQAECRSETASIAEAKLRETFQELGIGDCRMRRRLEAILGPRESAEESS